MAEWMAMGETSFAFDPGPFGIIYPMDFFFYLYGFNERVEARVIAYAMQYYVGLRFQQKL